MIGILVWSKDRACQLELLLRSIEEKLHIPFKYIHCIYKATDGSFQKGYDILIQKYNECSFHKETDFKTDTEKIVNVMSSDGMRFILFLCDDDVFINDVSEEDLKKLIQVYDNNPKVHSISLRMNPTVNYCYPARKPITAPQFIEKDKYLLWKWTDCNIHYCWGYPMAVNSHLYEISKILPIIESLEYRNPNMLEAGLNRNRNFSKPLMVSLTHTVVFNIQNNFVKDVIGQSFEKNVITVESLNKKFVDGGTISTENIYGLNPTQAHGSVEYLFK